MRNKAISTFLSFLFLFNAYAAFCQTTNRGTFNIVRSDTSYRVTIANKMSGEISKVALLNSGKLAMPLNKGCKVTGFALNIKFEYEKPLRCDTMASPKEMVSSSERLTNEMRNTIKNISNEKKCFSVVYFFHDIICKTVNGEIIKGNDIHLLLK